MTILITLWSFSNFQRLKSGNMQTWVCVKCVVRRIRNNIWFQLGSEAKWIWWYHSYKISPIYFNPTTSAVVNILIIGPSIHYQNYLGICKNTWKLWSSNYHIIYFSVFLGYVHFYCKSILSFNQSYLMKFSFQIVKTPVSKIIFNLHQREILEFI